MPGNTANIHEPVEHQHVYAPTLIDLAQAQADGGTPLLWSSKDDEIVFIAEAARGVETEFLVCALKERAGDAAHPFDFTLSTYAELPQDVLDRHLLKAFPRALTEDELHVIVSTRSGTGQAERFYDDVLRVLLEKLGLHPSVSQELPGVPGAQPSSSRTYNLLVTRSSQSIKEFATHLWKPEAVNPAGPAAENKGRSIVLLSGDGGVVDLLNGPDGQGDHRTAIALLPLGTGNALFHSLHKPHYSASPGSAAPSPLVLGLRSLFRGTASPLPTFRASFSPGATLVSSSPPEDAAADDGAAGAEQPADEVDHLYGAIVASYGFHAQLVWESDTPAYRRHGDKRFGMVAQELLKTSHAYRAAVEARTPAPPSVGLGRDTFGYVLVSMVSNLERNFTVSPASRPLDGKLRLVHFGAVGADRTMQIMGQAYRDGAHVAMRWTDDDGREDGVGYDEVDEVTVTVRERDARWRKVCIDGTIVEVPEGGWMSVRKAAGSRYLVLVH